MEWLNYLLKVSACMALFYAFYLICLQRLTFFNLNRFYLLITLFLSFIIPVIQLQVHAISKEQVVTREQVVLSSSSLQDLKNSNSVNQEAVTAPDNMSILKWEEMLFASYCLVAAIFFLTSVSQALQLLRYSHPVGRRIGRLKVIFKSKGFTNCSFFNYVFINHELTEIEIATILEHEQVHVSRYHSVDRILLSACRALVWFNPIVYFYDKALEQVHEYEADKQTSKLIGNTTYADVLLEMAVRKNNPPIAHSFVKNPLKARIKMLFAQPSKRAKKFAYLATLPVGLALVWVFAVQVVYASLPVQLPDESRKENLIRPVQVQEIPDTVSAARVLETAKTRPAAISSDTLMMIRWRRPSHYSEVIIDGKSYDMNILTKISPGCVKLLVSNGIKLECLVLKKLYSFDG